ncbi:MAG: hypothetical protein QG602_758 [Verrucomicrobiota bacterium]|nr:hypothetical protein [Verrucomicrobiota bacterium]
MKHKTNRPRTHRRPLQPQRDPTLHTQTQRRRLYTDFLALAFYPGMGPAGQPRPHVTAA